jgi:acyl dehydratase
MKPVYFEDFEVGARYQLGSVTVSEAEIIDFATKFDPQPFHIDREAAQSSPYGRLIASGWHTCALYMRLMVDSWSSDTQSQGSPGVEELRWLAPVFPDDVLSGAATVLAASATKPHRGTVTMLCELTNQQGVQVWRMTARVLFGRRSGAAASH